MRLRPPSDDGSLPRIGIALASTAAVVACAGTDSVDTLECGTELVLSPDGEIHLASERTTSPGHRADVRDLLPLVGDRDGVTLGGTHVVRAEDLIAGFVRRLHITTTELYSLPPTTECIVAHPPDWTDSAVAAMRDALDYVGLDACALGAARCGDAAESARALVPVAAPVASTPPRTRPGRRRHPTRAAVAAAAAAFAFLAIGGAWATHATSTERVAPSGSEHLIVPDPTGGAVVVQLPSSTADATPTVDLPPAETDAGPDPTTDKTTADTPGSSAVAVVPRAPVPQPTPPAPLTDLPALPTLPTDLPSLIPFPEFTAPATTAPTATTTAVTPTTSASSTPSRGNRPTPVIRP